MAHSKQTDLFSQHAELKRHRISHGGELAIGRRKVTRPLDRKRPVHLTLKSSHAKGRFSLLSAKKQLFINKTIRANAKTFGIKIHRFENMGNHCHLLLSFANREGVQNFMRTVTALIARAVTGAKRGKPFGKKFWDYLAFTRVVTGRRDFQNLMSYFQKNQIERDNGPLNREVVERYEEASRRAKRRGVDVWFVLDEWNQRPRDSRADKGLTNPC